MNPPKQRLFFALWPEAAARDALAGVIESLKPQLPARWIRPQNLHVTLAFLGDVEAERLTDLDAAADQVRSPGFELALDTIEYWRKPQILCLSPSAPQPVLETLAADLASQLRAADFKLEARPYRAHLSLARDAAGLPAETRLPHPIRWQAKAFVLAESVKDRHGSAYRICKAWPLA